MRICATCNEAFEDDMNFCTFDGSRLRAASPIKSVNGDAPAFDGRGAKVQIWSSEYQGTPPRGGRSGLFVLLTMILAVASAGGAYYLASQSSRPALVTETARSAAAIEPRPTPILQPPEPVEAGVSLKRMSRGELLDALPKNLLRRFYRSESAQGIPEDLRILNSEKTEYVVLVGPGRPETSTRLPTARILALRHEDGQFKDVTVSLLPRRYANGVITGQRSDVSFDDRGANLIIRQPASSTTVVDECSRCERAYQLVALEWKDGRYVETTRAWENDRYSALYVMADALDKRRVDTRARPFIDKSVDQTVERGFERTGKKGWVVEWRTDRDEADRAEYELRNGAGRLVIRVARVQGQWKVVEVN